MGTGSIIRFEIIMLISLALVGCALNPQNRQSDESQAISTPAPEESRTAPNAPPAQPPQTPHPGTNGSEPSNDIIAGLKDALFPPLASGLFEWYPSRSPSGEVAVLISLPEQMAYVYRNGILIGRSTVSTGKPGYETPTGMFTILQKKVDHTSNLYEDGEMPYMQRLTWDGIALHGGELPGYPASHGCVRLPMKFSRLLYKITRLGTPMIIEDEELIPAIMVTPGSHATSESLSEETPSLASAVKISTGDNTSLP